jgi:hypothetical protein
VSEKVCVKKLKKCNKMSEITHSKCSPPAPLRWCKDGKERMEKVEQSGVELVVACRCEQTSGFKVAARIAAEF